MNKAILISIIVVILIILVGGYFILYGGNQAPTYSTVNPDNTNFTPNAATPAPVVQSQQPTSQPTNQPVNLSAAVSIKNFAFDPTPLNIKAGTTVIWTNNDTVPHQIKADTFNSAVLNNGQTFSFTFSTAGQYSYSCAIHPSMHGQIVVTQ